MAHWISDPETWKLLSIPVVAGLIGWITNWLAVWMTFHPLKFVGVFPPWLGWQGIVPSKARRMAGLGVQSILSKLITMREVCEALDPAQMAHHIMERVDPVLDAWVEQMMDEHYPVLWDNLPTKMRRQVVATVRRKLPSRVDALMADVTQNADYLIHLRPVVEDHLAAHPDLLNRIFLECGEKEFKFLVWSGWLFGAPFGLLQAIAWAFVSAPWVLPAGGLVVGWATNWIALNLIFRPLHPRKIGPFTVQGLFLKRQNEVSEAFCRIVIDEVVTLPRLIDAMFVGPRQDRARALLRRHLKPLVDDVAGGFGRFGGVARVVVQTAVGPRSFAEFKDAVAEKAEHEAQMPFEDPQFIRDRGDRVRALIQKRMEALPPEDFQDLLRPCFQEDEWKLILVGAVLGGVAGLLQLVYVFGTGSN